MPGPDIPSLSEGRLTRGRNKNKFLTAKKGSFQAHGNLADIELAWLIDKWVRNHRAIEATVVHRIYQLCCRARRQLEFNIGPGRVKARERLGKICGCAAFHTADP
ncbi:hypothetical protein D9M72_173740 [compost metagenome]